jgi:hypothetical protein
MHGRYSRTSVRYARPECKLQRESNCEGCTQWASWMPAFAGMTKEWSYLIGFGFRI